MEFRNLFAGRSAVALLAAAFLGGCAAQPMAHPSEPPGLRFYHLTGDNLLADSYHWTVTGVGGDGLWYWTEVYYLHYAKKPEYGKRPLSPPHWDHRGEHHGTVKAANDPGADDAGADYGWYVQITHPGGDYAVVGTKTMITHPGGSPVASTAK